MRVPVLLAALLGCASASPEPETAPGSSSPAFDYSSIFDCPAGRLCACETLPEINSEKLREAWDPARLHVEHVHARALIRCERYEEALPHLESALVFGMALGGPPNFDFSRGWWADDAAIDLARLYDQRDQHEQGLARFQHLVDRYKKHYGARLGVVYFELHQYERRPDPETFEKIERQLQNALAVRPENPNALAFLVYANYLRGREDPGFTALAHHFCDSDAREKSGAFAAACAQLAFDSGRGARGRELFALAVATDPEAHDIWLAWADREFRVGNLIKARECLERAAQSIWSDTRRDANELLGIVRNQLGDADGAVDAYRAAIRISNDFTDEPIDPVGAPLELLFNYAIALADVGEEAMEHESQVLLRAYLDRTRQSTGDPRRLHARFLLNRTTSQ